MAVCRYSTLTNRLLATYPEDSRVHVCKGIGQLWQACKLLWCLLEQDVNCLLQDGLEGIWAKLAHNRSEVTQEGDTDLNTLCAVQKKNKVCEARRCKTSFGSMSHTSQEAYAKHAQEQRFCHGSICSQAHWREFVHLKDMQVS